jgi:Sec-independent protein secretion pathway component TatC
MLTEIMKWVSVVTLIAAVFTQYSSRNFMMPVQLIVCVAAGLVFVQAIRESKRFWAAGFLGIALLFNPVVPVALSRRAFLWLDAVCLAMFLFSLALLKTSPRLSVASIVDPGPRNQSL